MAFEPKLPKKYRKRTLCDWTRSDIEDHLALLAVITHEPRYACRKCARVAHSEDHLCKPRSLPKGTPRTLVG